MIHDLNDLLNKVDEPYKSAFFNHRDTALSSYATVGENGAHREAILGTLDLYPSRALCLTRPNDIIQLSPKLEKLWSFIQSHYRRVGLKVTQDVIWSDNLDEYKASIYSRYDFSGFMGTEELLEAYGLRHIQVASTLNSKTKFMELCVELGISTPETFWSRDYLSKKDNFPVSGYFKADESVSGLGVLKYDSPEELDDLVKAYRSSSWQVQRDVMPVKFLNLQYTLDDFSWKALAMTEQILNGNSHVGNQFPSSVSIETRDYGNILDHAQKFGFRGVLGLDVLVDAEGKSYVLECNPRLNGSTYPTVTAKRLGVVKWLAISVHSSFRDISEILERHSFDGNKGVVVFNWGALLSDKAGIMIAGDDNYQKEIMSLFTS